MSKKSIPRGIRNNNPGNIDYNVANKWQGLDVPPVEPTPADGSRARFARFVSPAFGIRAIARTLITYQDKHKIRTVHGMISRWAPGVENPTESYAKIVAKEMGVIRDARIDVHDYDTMRALVIAIIRHENGQQPYPPEVINEGLKLAGITPKPKPVIKDLDIVTGAGGTASGAASGVVEAVQDTMTGVSEMTPYLDTAKWLFLGLSVAMLSFTLWRLYRKFKAAQGASA